MTTIIGDVVLWLMNDKAGKNFYRQDHNENVRTTYLFSELG